MLQIAIKTSVMVYFSCTVDANKLYCGIEQQISPAYSFQYLFTVYFSVHTFDPVNATVEDRIFQFGVEVNYDLLSCRIINGSYLDYSSYDFFTFLSHQAFIMKDYER